MSGTRACKPACHRNRPVVFLPGLEAQLFQVLQSLQTVTHQRVCGGCSENASCQALSCPWGKAIHLSICPWGGTACPLCPASPQFSLLLWLRRGRSEDPQAVDESSSPPSAVLRVHLGACEVSGHWAGH